jgi:hypothetical protein
VAGFGYPEGWMRFLLRFFSLICLVVATIAGTVDSIQSIAASAVVMTSLGDTWKGLSPSTFENLQSAIPRDDGGQLYGSALHWTLAQPAFAVFLVIALLAWMVAYRRAPITRNFAV